MQPIYCQSKKLSKQSLFTLAFVQLLNIYFFSKSSSFQSMFRGLISDIGGRSCCQITLYILHFAQFPILIFKFNFAISSFGNFLRNVQLKWFHFKYLSHTTESVSMAIIFWQTKQNHFNFFSCCKVSNILPMLNLHNTFLLIFFLSDLIRDEKHYCLHIFHLFWDLI